MRAHRGDHPHHVRQVARRILDGHDPRALLGQPLHGRHVDRRGEHRDVVQRDVDRRVVGDLLEVGVHAGGGQLVSGDGPDRRDGRHLAICLYFNGDSWRTRSPLSEVWIRRIRQTMVIIDTIIGYVQSIEEDLIAVLSNFNPNKIALNYSLNSPMADGLTHGMFLQLYKYLEKTALAGRDRLL